MAKSVEIRTGSRTYSGKTKSAAVEAALQHLTSLFPDRETENWAPVVIRSGEVPGDTIGVVFKDSTGFWAYRLEWDDGSGSGCSHSGDWSKIDAEFRCRRHLAQATYRAKYETESLAILHKDDASGRDDHARWLRFQTEYAAARARGLDDDQARLVAAR